MFQHTAARRRLRKLSRSRGRLSGFQHTAARRRLPLSSLSVSATCACFNTQPPEGGCAVPTLISQLLREFQHTAARRRLQLANKSAHECVPFQHTAARRRLLQSRTKVGKNGSFNTQPPEGGCVSGLKLQMPGKRFNTQPPEGGCHALSVRPLTPQGFNTQPPEGGCFSCG